MDGTVNTIPELDTLATLFGDSFLGSTHCPISMSADLWALFGLKTFMRAPNGRK